MKLSGFIVGPERSGTTLTSANLSVHPDVYVINDPHYLNFFAGLLVAKQKSNAEPGIDNLNKFSSVYEYKNELEHSLNQVIGWYQRWEEFKGDGTDINRFFKAKDYLLNSKNLSLTQYFDYFHKSLIPKEIRQSKGKYIVKIPDLARFSFILNQLYEDIPVVFNIRHPVCNIASIIVPNRDRGWTYDQIINWYISFFPENIDSLFKNALFTRYEDLLLIDPSNTWNLIFKKFNLRDIDIWSNKNFDYPNKKVMRKTKGKIDVSRLTSSLKELSPQQILIALEKTKRIQEKYYDNLSLMKIIDSVEEAKKLEESKY